MNREEILEKVKDIVSELLCIEKEEISEKSNFLDLGADSLDSVEIVMALEDKFNLCISDEEADILNTVKSVVDYIEKEIDDTVV